MNPPGVDVGAKVEIYNIINEITAGGGAVLMVSSDLPEILGMSDRILVMSGGKIAGELPKDTTKTKSWRSRFPTSHPRPAPKVHDSDHDAAFATLKEDSQ